MRPAFSMQMSGSKNQRFLCKHEGAFSLQMWGMKTHVFFINARVIDLCFFLANLRVARSAISLQTWGSQNPRFLFLTWWSRDPHFLLPMHRETCVFTWQREGHVSFAHADLIIVSWWLFLNHTPHYSQKQIVWNHVPSFCLLPLLLVLIPK